MLTRLVINTCNTYGTSGKPQNVQLCVSAVNARTITCNPGYAITGTQKDAAITLIGNAAFPGCTRKYRVRFNNQERNKRLARSNSEKEKEIRRILTASRNGHVRRVWLQWKAAVHCELCEWSEH